MNPIKTVTDQFGFSLKNNQTGLPSLVLVFSDRQIGSFIYRSKPDGYDLLTEISRSDWGGSTIEELVVAADGVISSAINQVANQSVAPPTRVVLAVPYSWVDQDGLLKERSLMLANLTRRLGYNASGFVTVPEAVARYLKEANGVSDALYFQIEDNDNYLTLIRRGKVVGSVKINRSDDIVSDFEEGMVRLSDGLPFPPTIYLADYRDLQTVKNKLNSYPWPDAEQSRHPGFLQLTKFEICPSGFEAGAIVYQVTGVSMAKNDAPDNQNSTPTDKAGDQSDQDAVGQTGNETGPTDFISDEQPLTVLDPVKYGFSSDPTFQEEKPPIEMPVSLPSESPEVLLSEDNESVGYQSVAPKTAGRQKLKVFFGRPRLPRFGFKPAFITLIPIAMLTGIVVVYRLTASVNLRLIVNSNQQKQDIEITFSPTANQPDADKLIVPLVQVETNLTGSGQTDVRGTKTVGEKAKGEVIVYNGTASAKNLTKGTLIKSSTGLKFSLVDTILVPAKTTDLSVSPPVDKWGEKTALIVAADIGEQYNLAANSTFAFDSTASSSAWLIKNPSALTGGYSQQVEAVGQEDRDRLSKEVLADLTVKAVTQLEEKVGSSGRLLKDTVKLKNKTDRFDKSVGDEAEELKLEQTAVFTGQYYRPDDLFALLNSKLEKLVPVGYQQKPNLTEPTITLANAAKGVYRVEVTAEYIPQIDLTDLANKLVGKSVADGEAIIKSLANIAGYENEFKPGLFSFVKRYPFTAQKIFITLVAK